jgi:NADPH-dependent glutamate synthase beta subunit-like oxidoreductase/NAD-dependent dihydropyrimidine dehydrogenase PreA subunit
MSKKIAVYGSGWQAAQSALVLADLGIEVDLMTPNSFLDVDYAPDEGFNSWPLLLRAAVHPRVHLHTNSSINRFSVQGDEFVIGYSCSPRFVKEELCTACGECQKVCSVKLDGHSAIDKPITDAKSVPSTYLIEKDGISPCRGGCLLEINVHGYVSLIRQGKTAKALKLINEKAPLASVLGRLCTHPCEAECSRQEFDKPLFIQALHRYAADIAHGEVEYRRKTEIRHLEKIAIIGSGPSGLTAAWDLARRGYTPTIFESQSTAGGMLATAIPGFRLPAVVRQREIEAIQKLGVEIKTGVTFGRDVTLESLREEGFGVVFLAIGAQSNNKLNIPGENLNGVVDCISWLGDFNLNQDLRLDEKIIIIGGGNSAVDSARSAKRLSTKDVRILCLTEEMTAVPEEVEEAAKEEIPIDYNNSALEILGENGRVTGVRCVKVRNVQFDSEGRITLEKIAGSEYVVQADKVIIAIGQRPDSNQMNLKGLSIARNSTIMADPLTLATNLPAVFAGGDAVTGSRNVVSAMAAGLRAAESMDRYLRGQSLEIGRTLEPLKTVDVDISNKKPVRVKRAKMPALSISKRKNGHAETNLGLSTAQAEKESSRCLDCAGCCECLECEAVCEVKAVNHQDRFSEAEIRAAGLINLSNADLLSSFKMPGLYHVKGLYRGETPGDLARVSAVALNAALELKLVPQERNSQEILREVKVSHQVSPSISVFLCSCGAANSAILDFQGLEKEAARLPGVIGVHQIAQSCTAEGASQINEAMLRDGTQNVVIAACRCCNWDQVCYSCGDRRIMCRENIGSTLSRESKIEYVNIREMCAWLYRDDPAGATNNALQLITAGVRRAEQSVATGLPATGVAARALIISGGLSGLSAAVKLGVQGYGVTLLSGLDAAKLKSQSKDYPAAAAELLKQLLDLGVEMLPWPDALVLNGTPGRYEAIIKTGNITKSVAAGCVIADIAAVPIEGLNFLAQSNLLNRVIKRMHSDYRGARFDNSQFYPYSIRETAALLFISNLSTKDGLEQITTGEAAAARASVILNQGWLQPRGSSVVINRSLCRGCGDCSAVCSLIGMKSISAGLCYAEIDPALCLGCGMCVSVCPTGAIKQPAQTDAAIEASLEAIFRESQSQ